MTPTALELTRLIGKKELTFGCILESEFHSTWNRFLYESIEGKLVTIGTQFQTIEHWDRDELKIVGEPPELGDLFFWLNRNRLFSKTERYNIVCHGFNGNIYRENIYIPYDFSKDLCEQDEYTLEKILKLIKSHENHLH